jgi:hypothetical protein
MKLSADQTEPEKGGPKELGPGQLVGEGITSSLPSWVLAKTQRRKARLQATRVEWAALSSITPVSPAITTSICTGDAIFRSYLGVSFNSLLVSGVRGDTVPAPLSVNT